MKQLFWDLIFKRLLLLMAKGYGDLALIVIIDIELGVFKEEVYDKHGIRKSWYYICYYGERVRERDRINATVDEEFVLYPHYNYFIENKHDLYTEDRIRGPKLVGDTLTWSNGRKTAYTLDYERLTISRSGEVVGTLEVIPPWTIIDLIN